MPNRGGDGRYGTPIVVIVVLVLLHDLQAEVTDPDRSILTEPPRADDVRGASAAEDLPTDPTVMFPSPSSEHLIMHDESAMTTNLV
jgi:hypothetical protein